MHIIYKYIIPFAVGERITIPVVHPLGCLDVQYQEEDLCVWLHVAPALGEKELKVWIFGTGHPLPDDPRLQYLKTVQRSYITSDGLVNLVWHVFVEL